MCTTGSFNRSVPHWAEQWECLACGEKYDRYPQPRVKGGCTLQILQHLKSNMHLNARGGQKLTSNKCDYALVAHDKWLKLQEHPVLRALKAAATSEKELATLVVKYFAKGEGATIEKIAKFKAALDTEVKKQLASEKTKEDKKKTKEA